VGEKIAAFVPFANFSRLTTPKMAEKLKLGGDEQ
jgi:hypothetical protein